MSSLLAALAGALLWFLSGFVQGMLRTSSDPELILGLSQGLQALGLVMLVAAGVSVGRTVRDAQRG